jgi:hypothetical protein
MTLSEIRASQSVGFALESGDTVLISHRRKTQAAFSTALRLISGVEQESSGNYAARL